MPKYPRRVVVIIPARKGSKGLPGKNIKIFRGKPLLTWSIDSALHTDGVDSVFVSTDCDNIADIAKKAGALVPYSRPAELASDSASMVSVLAHFIDWFMEVEGLQLDEFVIALLQPTSPLRYRDTLEKALEQFFAHQVDALVGIVENHKYSWIGNPPRPGYDHTKRLNRQDIPQSKKAFYETGSIYIFNPANVWLYDNILAGRIDGYVQDFWEGFEIDDSDDWLMAELIYDAKFHNQV